MSNQRLEVIPLLDWLNTYRPIFETLYFIASIGLVATIIIGLRQVSLFKKDMKDRNRRASVEKSLEYLAMYASEIIPKTDEYDALFRQEIPLRQPIGYLFDNNFKIDPETLNKELKVENIIKYRLKLHNLINKLEFLSVGILNGLADDDIVYTPIARHYCNFIEEEHVFISTMRHRGAPFKNLLALYRKWKDRLDVDELELQKMEVENKIKQKGDGYKSTPPIGLGRKN